MNRQNKLKYVIKLIVAYCLYLTGILYICKMIWLKNKAIVLMYHRVLSGPEKRKSFSHDGIIVDKNTFEKQIRFLKKTFNVLSLDEFHNRIQIRKPFERYSCLITFDDGWRDNFTHAYPVLKKYKLPAVIFLPVDYIGKNNQFWQEKLIGLLYSVYHSKKPDVQELINKYNLKEVFKHSDGELRLNIHEFVSQKKSESLDNIEKIISDISINLGPPASAKNNIDTFLDWDQVEHMAKDGISFGSHGVNHKILTKISLDEVTNEIKQSKIKIENQLDSTASSFTYPNGDYSESIVNQVRANGYQLAFSTENGFVTSSDNPFTLKRINIHNDISQNVPMFMMRILGIF